MGFFDSIGKFFSPDTQAVQPSLVNAAQYQKGLDTAYGAYNANNEQMQALTQTGQGQQQRGIGLIEQYLQRPAAEYQYDPMAAQRLFLSNAPQLQNLARESVSDYAPDDLLRQEREMIMQQVGDSFGGNPMSGAFAQSASQALASPLLQRAQAQEQMRANLMGSLYGTSQGNLNQNVLQAAQMGYQQELADRARLMEGAGYMQQAAGQTLGQAGLYGQLAGQSLGTIGQLTNPVYSTPDYRMTPSLWDQIYNRTNQVMTLGSNIATTSKNIGGLFGNGGGTQQGNA